MNRLLLSKTIALVGLAYSANPLFGATFTAPLQLSEGTAPEGSYLTAAYDFGIPFAKIESVCIAFAMSNGYDGSIVSTGNSTYFRSLYGVLHGHPNPTEPDVP